MVQDPLPAPPPGVPKSTAATTATAAPASRPLRVLYLFSGTPRRLDMATCLQQLAGAWTLNLKTECVDVKRSAKHDLSLAKVRQSYLDRIAAKEFDAVLLSPPCATFSRAPWANFRGPRPVRSYECPRGLQTLTPAERDRAILGNIFADFSYEVATLVANGAAAFFAMEQPEDLGALASGPHEGLRPASMWQWPQLADLLAKGLRTVAFHQASFGTPYAKPTRLLLRTSLPMPDCVYEGVPCYDAKGCYAGPLPSAGGQGARFQRQATGAFKTSGSEQWPAKLWEASLAWVPNYSSVEEHADFARAKFEEDVREGLMAKMSMGEFLERYGEHTAIAALAVIVEDEELDKKRIIHDATHGVRVNHRVKCRDKLRSPGAREKKHLLREHEEEGETAFSVVGDIAKAHRRYKHSPKEHGYLACQVDTKEEVPGDPASQTVYVNLVGTFGLSCASYWWTRIAACGLRLTYHLLGPDFPLDLLLYADDLEAMGKGFRGRRGIPLSYLFLAALGYPFKWAKTRGGFRVEWLGMETEYTTYKLGLSLKRATWLIEWLHLLARAGKTEAKTFAQG